MKPETYVVLLPCHGTGPFAAWGTRLPNQDDTRLRVQIHRSWGLKAIAERESKSAAYLKFESWDADWANVVVSVASRDDGGPTVFETSDRAIAEEVGIVVITALQLFLDGAVSRAGLSDTDIAAIYAHPA